MQKLMRGEALLGCSLGDHGSQVEGIRASLEESRVSLRERFLIPSVSQDLITSVSWGVGTRKKCEEGHGCE